VVLLDHCVAGTRDVELVKRIVAAHETVPAVHLHCAMHSFRNGTDLWFRHLGLQSTRHGPKEPVEVEYVDATHPIAEGLENWTTIKEELYNNVDIFGAQPIAMGRQVVKRDGEEKVDVAVVAWTNETSGARSFSTSLGHYTETVADDRYLDLVTRGLLWTLGKLNDDYLGVTYEGENTIEFVKGKKRQPKKRPKAKVSTLGPAPKDATLVSVTAQSVQSPNETWKAVDGDPSTRWCARNGEKPQWIRLALDEPRDLTGAAITWERDFNAYQYTIEGSADGTTWQVLVDASANETKGRTEDAFEAKGMRFVRITTTNVIGGGWVSIREIELKGPGIRALHPKLDAEQQAAVEKEAKKAADPFAKEGNVKPRVVRRSPDAEAAILKDVTVPDGFEATLFSGWEEANYPVYVAASPDGTLYVSSDGNGSLGRDPHRGRVLRLRDADGDGRADEVKEFVPDIDSPRGLVWDHDRLYLLHPPHLSVFFDRDGDGVAEASQRLVSDIAFGFADRPADHTTNGLELGSDGWLYIAGGDFGFLEATGADGRKLQLRGGGVIRVRPDGTGMHIFASGTRNILGTPASPLLDLFARDNTNDGGGWDVRFHHFSGLEDHGYPRLYKNFPGETIQPVADYGGGSGCGSVYIHEPGFPGEWRNAPFTCDWGTGALWKHSVERKGASFVEVTEPQRFIRVTRPTDADVDGMSAVYQASWKGPATFRWDGPETGYIVRVTPKAYSPPALPDFANLTDAHLVATLESPSHVRTLAAQREILRREKKDETVAALRDLAGDGGKPLEARVAAVFALTQGGASSGEEGCEGVTALLELADETPDLAPFVTRAAGDIELSIDHPARDLLAEFYLWGIESKDARRRLEAIVASARQGITENAVAIATVVDDADPRIAHTAWQALAMLGGHDAAFDRLESGSEGGMFALMRMHEPEVVDGLIARLDSETDPGKRRLLTMALCRLYHVEGEWSGDSWGTRPDTRGPYYQPEPWSETEKIDASLKQLLASASPEEATFLVREMSRNRIHSDDGLKRVMALAREDAELIPEAVKQLAAAEEVPEDGVPILLSALGDDSTAHAVRADAVVALAKSDARDGVIASLGAFHGMQAHLEELQLAVAEAKKHADPHVGKSEGKYARQALADATKQFETARRTFLESPRLENHHLLIEETAKRKPESLWAHAALLALAGRKSGSPESMAMSRETVDALWEKPAHRAALIRAAAKTNNRLLDDRIRIAASDPDGVVADAATQAMKTLKIQAAGEDPTSRLATLSPEEAVAAVLNYKGDLALGEAVYARATCAACHTVSQGEPQKGPYLGNIAETYRRKELAEAILLPNKTIAQGFKTNVFTLEDGTMVMGFVTDEQGDKVTIRDIASQEHVLEKSGIKKRDTLPTSMMPPGLMMNYTVRELASLLDYLEALAKE